MSNLEYKDKYLKYKNKYLKHKHKLDQQNQKGANYFSDSEYAIFLNKYQIEIPVIKQTIKTNIIDDFDKFTDDLGSCALFLKIGHSITGKDMNNTYNTIYPNKTIFQGYDVTNVARDALTKIFKGLGGTFVKIGDEDENNKIKTVVGGGCGECQDKDKNFYVNYICKYESFPLDATSTLKKIENLVQLYDPALLMQIVNGINSKIVYNNNCGNEIKTVLLVNKKSMFSKQAEIIRRYDISYSSDNKSITNIIEIKFDYEKTTFL